LKRGFNSLNIIFNTNKNKHTLIIIYFNFSLKQKLTINLRVKYVFGPLTFSKFWN